MHGLCKVDVHATIFHHTRMESHRIPQLKIQADHHIHLQLHRKFMVLWSMIWKDHQLITTLTNPS